MLLVQSLFLHSVHILTFIIIYYFSCVWRHHKLMLAINVMIIEFSFFFSVLHLSYFDIVKLIIIIIIIIPEYTCNIVESTAIAWYWISVPIAVHSLGQTPFLSCRRLVCSCWLETNFFVLRYFNHWNHISEVCYLIPKSELW